MWRRGGWAASLSAMCGFAGVLRRDGRRVDPTPIGAMLDRIAYRGPDGRGTWSEGPVALGHVRLAILDRTERAAQPMVRAAGDGVLVYVGEVYNHHDLRADLEREGVRFRSSGDTEVVLEALHRWGPEVALPRFDGMFALAWYDRREGRLWLARDRLGIKPLFVAERGDLLLFASEVKALRAHPAAGKGVDRHALAVQLAHGRLGSGWTLLEGIRELRPGTWRSEGPGGTRQGTWFDLLAAVDPERIARGAGRPRDAAVPEVEEALRASVRLHLASEAPLAAMVSGGVDSGLVASYAREALGDLHAYVADVEGETEYPRAVAVARHLGIPLHRVRVGRSEWLELWPQALWHVETPTPFASDPALLALTRAARRDGVEVLLTGEGADEMFGGYAWHERSWRRQRRRGWLARLGRRRALERRRLSPLSGALGSRDADARLAAILALDTESELRTRRVFAHLAPVGPPADRAFLAHGLEDLLGYLPMLLARHDRLGMAAGVETRVPFLENRLIDLAVHLPAAAKRGGGRPKRVLKRIAESRLPRRVVHLPKKGFPVPEAIHRGTEGLLRGGRLADLLGWSRATTEEVLGLVGPRAASRLSLAALEVWLRLFVGDERPAEVAEALRRVVGPPYGRPPSGPPVPVVHG